MLLIERDGTRMRLRASTVEFRICTGVLTQGRDHGFRHLDGGSLGSAPFAPRDIMGRRWFLAYRYTRWKGVVSGKIAFGIHSSFHFKRKHVLLGHDVGSWISNSFFVMLSYSYSRKQD